MKAQVEQSHRGHESHAEQRNGGHESQAEQDQRGHEGQAARGHGGHESQVEQGHRGHESHVSGWRGREDPMGQKISPIFFGHLSGTTLGDSALVLQVSLVTTQHHVGVFAVGVRLQLREPVTHVQERLLARQVKQQQKAHRITEKRCRQTAKPAKEKHFFNKFRGAFICRSF